MRFKTNCFGNQIIWYFVYLQILLVIGCDTGLANLKNELRTIKEFDSLPMEKELELNHQYFSHYWNGGTIDPLKELITNNYTGCSPWYFQKSYNSPKKVYKYEMGLYRNCRNESMIITNIIKFQFDKFDGNENGIKVSYLSVIPPFQFNRQIRYIVFINHELFEIFGCLFNQTTYLEIYNCQWTFSFKKSSHKFYLNVLLTCLFLIISLILLNKNYIITNVLGL